MQTSDDDDLEGDVLRYLRSVEYGAWNDAAHIGLVVGFDKHVAAVRVRGTLLRLIKQGLVERDKSEKPIIYRIKK